MTKKTNKNKKSESISFPENLVKPIGDFLKNKLNLLEKRKKSITKEDPFSNEDRVLDNASPDTDAEEQFGHARTSAIRAELDKKIIQTKKALARIKVGKYGICERCGNMIDTERLMIYPEATFCVSCEAKRENKK